MAQYILMASLEGAEVNGEQITGATLQSDIFNSKKEALTAKSVMLANWGVNCELKNYDSEPVNDGYDYDKYN